MFLSARKLCVNANESIDIAYTRQNEYKQYLRAMTSNAKIVVFIKSFVLLCCNCQCVTIGIIRFTQIIIIIQNKRHIDSSHPSSPFGRIRREWGNAQIEMEMDSMVSVFIFNFVGKLVYDYTCINGCQIDCSCVHIGSNVRWGSR